MKGEALRTPNFFQPQISWITRIMTMNELFPYTFQALRHALGHDRPDDPRPLWERRLSAESDFCRAVVACGYLTREQMQRAAQRYRLGRSRDGGVIFWQIDPLGQVCDGKIMHYRPDCHRDHSRHPDWVMSLLRRHYLKDEPDLVARMPAPVHCLFGTHLLNIENSKWKIEHFSTEGCIANNLQSSIFNFQSSVAVVESEKTAVIMSERYPDHLWLATGGLNELTPQKLFPLRGRRIILFPDTDPEGRAYATWYRVVQEAEHLLGQPIHLSSLLERHATPEQKARKIDIADLILKHEK